MSIVVVVIQILFITLGMIIFGMVLNHFLGLTKEKLADMRNQALNLRERMKTAQLTGDYQSMAKLQQQSVQFMKLIMKKQMIPLCLRCLIFIVLFMVLGLIYTNYASGILPFPIFIFGSGWLALYIIFSLYFSLFIWGVKKLTGLGSKTQSSVREIMGIVSPTQQGTGLSSYSTSSMQERVKDYDDIPRKDSWKERIEE
jgi:uncharacterized membrane protein (DUF106 family)